ncbi:hypothetical protein Tco_1477911 [Tanacetum coccineum]
MGVIRIPKTSSLSPLQHHIHYHFLQSTLPLSVISQLTSSSKYTPLKHIYTPSKYTFKRIAAKWGELLDVDDYHESNLYSKRICILFKVCEHIHESFKIVFRGKVYWVHASEVLGWTLKFSEEEEEDELSVEDNNDGRINNLEANNGIDESDVEEVLETLVGGPKCLEEGLNEGNTVNLDMKDYGENERDDNSFVNLEDGKDNSESVNKNSESKRSGHSKYSVLPRTGVSILNLIEEVLKVGQTMGYNMDGCINDITEIIESQGEFGVNR